MTNDENPQAGATPPRRVLIVGADFAPSSLPPALRIRFFANHLRSFGWEPTILTTDPKCYNWSYDPEIANLLPNDLRVIRTPALPMSWARKIGFTDIGMRSIWHHWKAIVDLCRRREVDVILIPVPPTSPMILGRLAHARFGIPYVIDYIDPWMSKNFWQLPREQRPPRWPLVWILRRLIEPSALKKVAFITGVSQGTNDIARERSHNIIKPEQTLEIPYGGEALDFDYVRRNPRPNPLFDPKDGKIHISYVGAFIPAMHRTTRALFRAIRRGLEQYPELFSRLQLNFVGTTYNPAGGNTPQVLPLAAEFGIEDQVRERPARVSILEALQIQLDSHALIAIGSDAPHYTASKIFPYILSRKPLLALFHQESSVVRILGETRAGAVVTYGPETPPESKIDEILEALKHLLELPTGYAPETNWAAFDAYTARAMAAQLAKALDYAYRTRSG